METRIQFRINEETKRLAQQSADRRGVTLSDACRKFTEELADEQLKVETQEQWLKHEVERAFAKLESGQAEFFAHADAKQLMQRRKEAIKARKA
ncbi:type II toxin-antitoxin system RelB/DinJ family antitoxin [Enterobacter hormaechei]|nr:type II toxin-antitoxin system RelB/DinJ family antitoxin [Enterobacter hormaechei]